MAFRTFKLVALNSICLALILAVAGSSAFDFASIFRGLSKKDTANYRDCNSDYRMDYLALALQWPPGVCSTGNKDCHRGANVNNFTIHGFWPGRYTDRMQPNNCCFERQFHYATLDSISEQLKVYWYGFFIKDDSQAEKQFWRHEWSKHGTCCKEIDRLHGEFNYFNTTLHMFLNLPIMDTLARSLIVPDNTISYKSGEIIETLKSIHSGKSVEVGCNFEHDKSVPDLIGLNFCFSPKLEPVDCPASRGRCAKDITFKKAE